MIETLIANRPDLWLGVEKTTVGTDVELTFKLKGSAPYVLHWGFAKQRPGAWQSPEAKVWPAQTRAFSEQAVQTSFTGENGDQQIMLRLDGNSLPHFLAFVLFCPETRRWENNGSKDFYLPLAERQPGASPLADRIIEGEMGQHGWTLMHRFTLCHELMDEVRDSRDGWVTLFVWLRFSAIRQLTWQRNFNTKPKELSHAQDRLTLKLASLWRQQPGNRDLIRLALTGVGRGGDGQRIRDEILQIMHRHHIKEVGGTWMEQWHQKLHNNTTPDDIVICEAYLAFLYNHGNLNRYFETLAAGGVTKERLAHFDRPITNQPEWHPHLRDALLYDFGNYLKLLKSVHSATDLETAANSAGHLLDGGAREALNFIRQQFHNPGASITDLVASISAVRKNVVARLQQEGDAGTARELLCLDLALEDILRVVIERSIHSGFTGEQLFHLIQRVLENLIVARASRPCDSGDDSNGTETNGRDARATSSLCELVQCQREWQRLPSQNRFTPDWSLHAKAALDRLGRAIADGIDRSYQELQPRAEQLGQAFNADEWSVKLFSEEVVRGQPAFVLSLLIRHLDPLLRKSAKLGDWQIISPSTAIGQIEVVESLREIQGKKFGAPTIVIAEKVHGDEEPPEGVRAVITPSSVDLVSHVAVRARNANLLFATCYDPANFDRLRAMKGKVVELKINAAGDVLFAESSGPAQPAGVFPATTKAPTKIQRAKPTLQPLGLKEFARGAVGGKSFHLKTLAEKLPAWIHTPRSVALPFGTFDAVLGEKANGKIAGHYAGLVSQLDNRAVVSSPSPPPKEERAGERMPLVSSSNPSAMLTEIRQCILELTLPESLRAEIQRVMQAEGLVAQASRLFDPEEESNGRDARATMRIKQVWASQWNDRAYFSREARGFPHDAVQMAVLIQEVVEAEYAFVLHTVNPLNGNRDELYVEVVRGLGETLVGNYPGRAMSFIWAKQSQRATVLAFPGKNLGLFGGGLIFRSDSNAEDLAGYAGAGLYDSVLLQPPREETLDYTGDRLVWDESFRAEFAGKIAQLSSAVESAFGSAQDVEGAFAGGKFFVVQSRPQVGL